MVHYVFNYTYINIMHIYKYIAYLGCAQWRADEQLGVVKTNHLPYPIAAPWDRVYLPTSMNACFFHDKKMVGNNIITYQHPPMGGV